MGGISLIELPYKKFEIVFRVTQLNHLTIDPPLSWQGYFQQAGSTCKIHTVLKFQDTHFIKSCRTANNFQMLTVEMKCSAN